MKLLSSINQSIKRLKLGQRLTLYVTLIFLSVILVVLSSFLAIQYYFDHKTLYEQTANSMETIHDALAISLWQVERAKINLILEGANNLPYISGLKVQDPVSGLFQVGDLGDLVIERDLIYDGNVVGQLIVSPNEQLVRNQFLELALIFSVGTLLVFGLIVYLLNTMLKHVVTVHLKHIASFASSSVYQNPRTYSPIKMQRADVVDEITDLVKILNQAQKNNYLHDKERKVYQDKLQQQADHDGLTQLPNRHHANQFITEAIRTLETSKYHIAVLFIDLDGFKEINDTLGHNIGDTVLVHTAARFSNLLLSSGGYVARYGGDEFIVALTLNEISHAEKMAVDLAKTLEDHFEIEGNLFNLSCSIGITASDNPNQIADVLIQQADIAMYEAKNTGKNRFSVYNPSMSEKIIQATTIKKKLQIALENDQLQVYYQPLVDIQSQEIIGFEALLRWFDEDGSFIPPDVFIPIAEKSGMGFALDQWVFSKAVNQVSLWREQMGKDFMIAINFSPSNFVHKELYQWFDSEPLFKTSLDWVELEVTERLMLNDENLVSENLQKLQSYGLKLSIDDFGTGYSSLGYIQQFSRFISKIKIDRMFVNQLTEDKTSDALVRTIVTMANSLSIDVLAEGIETLEQSTKLYELGCLLAQGYYYARPMPREDIEALVSDTPVLHKQA